MTGTSVFEMGSVSVKPTTSRPISLTCCSRQPQVVRVDLVPGEEQLLRAPGGVADVSPIRSSRNARASGPSRVRPPARGLSDHRSVRTGAGVAKLGSRSSSYPSARCKGVSLSTPARRLGGGGFVPQQPKRAQVVAADHKVVAVNGARSNKSLPGLSDHNGDMEMPTQPACVCRALSHESGTALNRAGTDRSVQARPDRQLDGRGSRTRSRPRLSCPRRDGRVDPRGSVGVLPQARFLAPTPVAPGAYTAAQIRYLNPPQ